MAVIEKEVVFNGHNIVFLSGHIDGIQYDKNNEKLSFFLWHASTQRPSKGEDEVKYFTFPTKVVFKGKSVKNYANIVEEDRYVLVEGKLRKPANQNFHIISGVHIQGFEQFKRKIKIHVPDKEERKDEKQNA